MLYLSRKKSNDFIIVAFYLFPSQVLLTQFLHQFPQPLGNGDSQCSYILDNAQTFIGEIEENHGRSQGFTGTSQKGLVQEVPHAHHQKDEDFFENPFETLGTGKLSLLSRGQNSGQVVNDHKDGEAY